MYEVVGNENETGILEIETVGKNLINNNFHYSVKISESEGKYYLYVCMNIRIPHKHIYIQTLT